MKLRSLLFGPALGLAALGVVACGDDSGSTPTTPAASGSADKMDDKMTEKMDDKMTDKSGATGAMTEKMDDKMTEKSGATGK